MPNLAATTPDRQQSRQRVIDHGEVFTPAKLVNDMLDLVQHECERIDSRFLEPACGNGNFLVEVLNRKLNTVDKQNKTNRLHWERDAVIAVCSLYGIDLLADNVEACRVRLLETVETRYQHLFKDHLRGPLQEAVTYILARNIVQGDALSFHNSEDKPIIFSEWSPFNANKLKRRDFSFENLLNHNEQFQKLTSTPLFSDLDKEVHLPLSVREFPPCHYLDVIHMEEAVDRP